MRATMARGGMDVSHGTWFVMSQGVQLRRDDRHAATKDRLGWSVPPEEMKWEVSQCCFLNATTTLTSVIVFLLSSRASREIDGIHARLDQIVRILDFSLFCMRSSMPDFTMWRNGLDRLLLALNANTNAEIVLTGSPSVKTARLQQSRSN